MLLMGEPPAWTRAPHAHRQVSAPNSGKRLRSGVQQSGVRIPVSVSLLT